MIRPHPGLTEAEPCLRADGTVCLPLSHQSLHVRRPTEAGMRGFSLKASSFLLVMSFLFPLLPELSRECQDPFTCVAQSACWDGQSSFGTGALSHSKSPRTVFHTTKETNRSCTLQNECLNQVNWESTGLR